MGNILVTGRGVVNRILGVGVSEFAGLHSVDARLALHCIALPCISFRQHAKGYYEKAPGCYCYLNRRCLGQVYKIDSAI